MASHSLIDGTEVKVPQFVGKRSLFKGYGEMGMPDGPVEYPLIVNVFQNKNRDRIKYCRNNWVDSRRHTRGNPPGWDCVYRIVVRPKPWVIEKRERRWSFLREMTERI